MDQNAIFKAIQDKFDELGANAGRNMVILIIIILLFLFFLILYRLGQHSRSVKEWQTDYYKLIRKFDLTVNELDLLGRMALYLDDPARKNLLLSNRNTFHHALMLLEKKEGGVPRFADSLTHKVYGEGVKELPEGFEMLFGLGRPVRFISSDGSVYGGQIIQRENRKIILGNVHSLTSTLEHQNVSGEGRVFIQDFRGLISHGVAKKTVLSETSLELDLGPVSSADSKRNKFRLPNIYIFPPGSSTPMETHFYKVSEGMGVVENPGGILKMDQSVKVALQKDTSHHYHVNALVRWVSLNKRYAKLKFGYLDEKFY